MPTEALETARTGDVVVVDGRHVGDHRQTGEILEVLGDGPHPHYRVRWADGHESILYPGEGTTIDRSMSPAAGIAD